MKLVGLDTTSSEKKASGLAIYNGEKYTYHLPKTDDEIIKLCEGADLIAIDSPLKLPAGFCCLELSCNCHEGKPNGRSCERELHKMGIPLYYTTKKSIIKTMIYRAMKLVEILGENRVIEIYPYSIKVRLFGKPVGMMESWGFTNNPTNYNTDNFHITGQVIALEEGSYGTAVVLNNGGKVTLPQNTKLLIGKTYDFIYEEYTLKVDNWWNHFIGTKDAKLIGFNLQ